MSSRRSEASDSFGSSRPWSDSGRRTTNSLPCSSPALLGLTVPPCISTRFFTSVRPMPSPPCERVAAWSTCTNRSKILGSMSGAMPMPVSRTRSTASRPSRSGR